METSSRDEQGCASLLTKAFLISLPAQLRGGGGGGGEGEAPAVSSWLL